METMCNHCLIIFSFIPIDQNYNKVERGSVKGEREKESLAIAPELLLWCGDPGCDTKDAPTYHSGI